MIKNIENNINEMLSVAEDCISPLVFQKEIKQGTYSNLFSRLKVAKNILNSKPYLIYIAATQWIIYILAYLLGTKLLIVYEELNIDSDYIVTISFLALFLVASLFVGFLSTCIGIAYFSKKVTITNIVNTFNSNFNSFLLFFSIDYLISVQNLNNKLSREKDSDGESTFTPASFFTWKIFAMAIFPSIIHGKKFNYSCEPYLKLVEKNWSEYAALQYLFSGLTSRFLLVCSVIAFFILLAFSQIVGSVYPLTNYSPSLLTIIESSVCFSLSWYMILFRPFYLVLICNLFEKHQNIQ